MSAAASSSFLSSSSSSSSSSSKPKKRSFDEVDAKFAGTSKKPRPVERSFNLFVDRNMVRDAPVDRANPDSHLVCFNNNDDYKVLYLLLKDVTGDLPNAPKFYSVLSLRRMAEYDAERSPKGTVDVERDMHEFVDYFNFYLLRALAMIRTYVPELRRATILQICRDEYARIPYIALVQQLWKYQLYDSGRMTVNSAVLAKEDMMTIEHLSAFDVFRQPTRKLQANLKLSSFKADVIDESTYTDAPSKLDDGDVFETPARPLNFFARLLLQAVQHFSIDELKEAFTRMRVPDALQVDGSNREDADPEIMRLINPFGSRVGQAFQHTMRHLMEICNVQSSHLILQHIKKDLMFAALVAHQVQLNATKSFPGTAAQSNAGRLERLDQFIDAGKKTMELHLFPDRVNLRTRLFSTRQ
jgi:hypothetical protein